MIFRQLFDPRSSTYSYLIASRTGGEALIIDPVLDNTEHYVRLLSELGVRLVKAVDTHLHADHISGLPALRQRTKCITVMGEQTRADVVAMRLRDHEKLTVEDICLDVIYTPGHTEDSYSFVMADRVFTGDTLLIRGTGRTDFQNGSARAQYHSIFDRLLKLPADTLVFPAHDYRGNTVSTIGEERQFNPRLQVGSVEEYEDLMANVKLATPKMMDVAVPANLRLGLDQRLGTADGWVTEVGCAIGLMTAPNVQYVDLREPFERARDGQIPRSIFIPYPELITRLAVEGRLFELRDFETRVLFICSFGELSAMAVELSRSAGYRNASHVPGGFQAWSRRGGPLAFGEVR